jgi:hypothetical protein
VVFKVPLDEADVRADGKKKILFQDKTFHVMGTWGSHASRSSPTLREAARRG